MVISPQKIKDDDYFFFKSLISTMNTAEEKCFSSVKHALIVAEEQESGFGRTGEKWISLPGNLHMTYVFQLERRIEGISLIAGLAVSFTAEHLWNLRLLLKWPNDLILHKRKVGGVLIRFYGNDYCLFGCGLNIVNSPPGFVSISDFATLKKTYSIKEISIRICDNFNRILSFVAQRGFDYVISLWHDRAFGLNKKCIFLANGREESGIFLGLNPQGAMRIFNSNSGEENVFLDATKIRFL